MKKLLLLFSVFTIAVIGKTEAQTLRIDSILFPTSCDSGSNPTLNFNISYSGPYLYNETIIVNYRVKNSKTNRQSSIITDTLVSSLDTLDNVVMNPSLHILGTNGFFVSPEDIIVIWPTGSGGIPITGDSIIDTVHVNQDTIAGGIKTTIGTFAITVFPNPSENLLFLNYDVSRIDLEQVRIYNILGKTVLLKYSSFNAIDITELPDDLYFLEATAIDKSRYVTQFVKNH